MMITSFRHDKIKRDRRRKIFTTLLVLSVIMFFARGPLSTRLGGVLAFIGRPFWAVEEIVLAGVDAVQAQVKTKSSLEEENTHLRELLDSVALSAHTRNAIEDENAALKAKLGRNPEYSLTVARVLSSPPVSPYDTLLIDAGTDHGVALGMDVFSDGDWKIGQVTHVWGRSSLVTLYSAPDIELSVAVGSSSIPAVAHGIGGGNFRIILPKGVDVSENDLVSIPALAPEYLAKVKAIEKPAGSSLEALFLQLPFNVLQLKWVYVAHPVSDKKAN